MQDYWFYTGSGALQLSRQSEWSLPISQPRTSRRRNCQFCLKSNPQPTWSTNFYSSSINEFSFFTCTKKENKNEKKNHLLNTGDSRPVMPPSQRALFHTQQTLKASTTQDLDPRPLVNNDHPSILPHELYLWNRVKSRLTFCPGHLWDSSVTLSGVPMTIGSLFQFGRSGFTLTWCTNTSLNVTSSTVCL